MTLPDIQQINPLLFRIILPTPFHVGPVNVYLIKGSVPTLVDTGPHWPPAWEALQKALEALDCPVEKLGQVVLTHGHVDHSGQAHRIQKISGAEVFLHAGDAFRVRQPFSAYGEGDLRYLDEFYAAHGIPESITAVVKKTYAAYYTQFFEPPARISLVEDGQKIEAAPYTFSVVHCPGHAPGSICLWEAEKKFLLSGDHLLKDITPNPVLEVPYNGRPRFPSLIHYIKSLEKVKALTPLRALPAHGSFIEDMPALIDYLCNHHRIRRTLLKGFLRRGPKTIYELCLELFGELPPQQMYLEVSEILGHLDVIHEEGLLSSFKAEERIYYQLVTGGS
jgi:glyoxylase-like metal-dependent hydrolase (beta-lactamase superfamily II)